MRVSGEGEGNEDDDDDDDGARQSPLWRPKTVSAGSTGIFRSSSDDSSRCSQRSSSSTTTMECTGYYSPLVWLWNISRLTSLRLLIKGFLVAYTAGSKLSHTGCTLGRSSPILPRTYSSTHRRSSMSQTISKDAMPKICIKTSYSPPLCKLSLQSAISLLCLAYTTSLNICTHTVLHTHKLGHVRYNIVSSTTHSSMYVASLKPVTTFHSQPNVWKSVAVARTEP